MIESNGAPPTPTDRILSEVRSLNDQLQQTEPRSELLEQCSKAFEQMEKEVQRLQREERTLLESVRYTREQLEQKIEEISLVRLVAEVGIRCFLSENPLQFILEQVCQLTEAEHGSIILLDSEEGRLYLAASSGPKSIPPYERSYKLGEGIAKWVDRSLSVPKAQFNTGEVEVLRESDEAHGSILCYPLIVDQTLVGVLSIGHHREGAFTTNTERILYIITNQVALAVYNTHLLSLHQKQRTSLERTNERYRSLVERVNELLDLSRLETGHLELEKSPLRLREILAGLRPKYKPQLRDKKLRMQVLLPKRILSIEGDGTRLQQAIHLLLENTIRSTPEHGLIRFQLSIEHYDDPRWQNLEPPPGCEKFLLFSLTDTAPTIPSQMQGILFQKIQDEKAEQLAASGRGSLSLYLVREIIEAHGGQIWLQPGEDEGNTYCFSLPVP